MKKAFSVIGIFVGIAFILVGILTLSGVLGGNAGYPSGAPFGYDSGYASFGADYYTYSVNNTAKAASAAYTAAAGVSHLGEFARNFFGTTSILFGLLVICAFTIVASTCPKPEKKVVVETTEEVSETNFFTEEAPTEEAPAEEAPAEETPTAE